MMRGCIVRIVLYSSYDEGVYCSSYDEGVYCTVMMRGHIVQQL